MARYSTDYMYKAKRMTGYWKTFRNPAIAQALNLGSSWVSLIRKAVRYDSGKRDIDSKDVSYHSKFTKAPNYDRQDFSDGSVTKNTSTKSLDFTNPRDIQIYLADPQYYGVVYTRPYVKLDFIPINFEYQSQSRLENLGVVSLNFPQYHWGGSEDTLSFTIDWYDYPQHSDRVIEKCRKVAALSKADGYRVGPPVIIVNWGTGSSGNSNKGLFDNHYFIVKSADYQPSLFLRNRSKLLAGGLTSTGNVSKSVGNGLMPLHATQRVILKRVGSQLTHQQIIGKSLV